MRDSVDDCLNVFFFLNCEMNIFCLEVETVQTWVESVWSHTCWFPGRNIYELFAAMQDIPAHRVHTRVSVTMGRMNVMDFSCAWIA